MPIRIGLVEAGAAGAAAGAVVGAGAAVEAFGTAAAAEGAVVGAAAGAGALQPATSTTLPVRTAAVRTNCSKMKRLKMKRLKRFTGSLLGARMVRSPAQIQLTNARVGQ
jgi:hypothetical protein